MNFENTLTETDLDPAAREFARKLREQGLQRDSDFGVDAFQESLGARFLRLLGLSKK